MIILILFLIIVYLIYRLNKKNKEKEIRSAGRSGEKLAYEKISSILNDDDYLLTNIEVEFDEQETELDNLVINKNGIFIIEVKNFNGKLYGKEDDKYWLKIKESSNGRQYEKELYNPIGQLRREIYILSKHLRNKGIKVWILGFVFLLNGNSPCESDYILENENEIEKMIHKKSQNLLNKKEIQMIIKELED